jgi:hypothetical protein
MRGNIWTLIVTMAIFAILLMLPIMGSVSTETIKKNIQIHVIDMADKAERR